MMGVYPHNFTPHGNDIAADSGSVLLREGRAVKRANTSTALTISDLIKEVLSMAVAALNTPEKDSQAVSFNEAALRVLLAFAAAEPNPAFKADMLCVLRADGHLPAEAA